MYDVYLGTMLCPVAPEKINLKVGNKNKSLILINQGEINILKKAGLSEISFDLLFPNVKYPFAIYKSGFKSANYFLEILEELKTSGKPFKFKIIRTFPDGKMIFDTNIEVGMEDYSIADDAKEGFDITVNVKLKQYKHYGTKICKIKNDSGKPTMTEPTTPRQTNNSPKPPENKNKTYTVKKGDCLWNIAKKFYGNGSDYNKILEANKGKVSNPNLIYPGQEFIIPG